MKSVVSILLVEDDTRTCRELEDCLDGKSELELLGITSSSIEAFQMVCDMLPDVIILDPELHEEGGSGLSLLKALQNAPVDVHPYRHLTTPLRTIGTTTCTTPTITQRMRGWIPARSGVISRRCGRCCCAGKTTTPGVCSVTRM